MFMLNLTVRIKHYDNDVTVPGVSLQKLGLLHRTCPNDYTHNV